MFRLNRDRRGANLVLEILMIVVGINVALWFESWFQDLQDAEIALDLVRGHAECGEPATGRRQQLLQDQIPRAPGELLL